MIYELHGKIPRNSSFIYSEDVLTSTIFGNLRYFNDNCLLNDFTSQATDLNGGHLSDTFSEKTIINFWRKYPSKTEARINEPDLLLKDDEKVLIIECKYSSLLGEENVESKKDYTNQLIRYSTILEEHYSKKKSKNIIFLTTKDYSDDIERVFSETKKKLPKNVGLYWLTWECLYKSLLEYHSKTMTNGEKNLLNDLKEFLAKRNLVSFTGIKVQDLDFLWRYKTRYCFDSKYDSFNWRYER